MFLYIVRKSVYLTTYQVILRLRGPFLQEKVSGLILALFNDVHRSNVGRTLPQDVFWTSFSVSQLVLAAFLSMN